MITIVQTSLYTHHYQLHARSDSVGGGGGKEETSAKGSEARGEESDSAAVHEEGTKTGKGGSGTGMGLSIKDPAKLRSVSEDSNERAEAVSLGLASPVVGKPGKTGAHNFRGVRLSSNGRWQARISIAGKIQDLGLFATAERAARRFDREAKKLGRPLNFPESGNSKSVASMFGFLTWLTSLQARVGLVVVCTTITASHPPLRGTL